MRDDEDPHPGGTDQAHEVTALRAALQRQREALQVERRRAQRWEREAALRASTVAGTLTTRILAAQRLASVVERNLKIFSVEAASAAEEVRDALEFFREVADDPATP